jgi:hypothetical protein
MKTMSNRVTYTPPIGRATYDSIRDIARRSFSSAEISEVVFPSGKRLVIIRQDEFDGAYIHLEPGESLVYDTDKTSLYVLTRQGERK